MNDLFLEIKDKPLMTAWCIALSPTPHIHKEIEIIYVRRGTVLCYADDKMYRASDGDMFVAFPNQVHYYLDSQFGEYGLYIFSADILYNLKNIFFENIPDCNILHLDKDSPLRNFLEDIADAYGEFRETLQVGLLNQIMPVYLSCTGLKNKTSSSSPNLQKILDYCSRNFTKEISLDSVADELHISKYYVSRLLNRRMNIGFNRYINTLRVSSAMELMQKGDENMTNIAEKVGFGTIRSFNRAFLDITNTNPREYCKRFK